MRFISVHNTLFRSRWPSFIQCAKWKGVQGIQILLFYGKARYVYRDRSRIYIRSPGCSDKITSGTRERERFIRWNYGGFSMPSLSALVNSIVITANRPFIDKENWRNPSTVCKAPGIVRLVCCTIPERQEISPQKQLQTLRTIDASLPDRDLEYDFLPNRIGHI